MNLSEDVDLEDYVSRPEKISGAEIACIVQEAGMQAVRNNRYVVLPKDFEKGYKANTQKNDKDCKRRRIRTLVIPLPTLAPSHHARARGCLYRS